MKAAANPDAFVAELSGWQAELVTALRGAVNSAAAFDEIIKWGNLVFVHNGLCILIHVEDERVVFGFWRGKRLTGIEPRIKPSGKYELGNIVFREGERIESDVVTQLASEAARLNREVGDPTALAD
ncbi:DUF1801 domain-containing protein [Altererythrobacter sp. Root672]|uniref:DUF1801 domain-containing protein n=1 Tax=Altererythrobacter sp. Root672 TaxID=1736584 RepID=UPI0006FAB444|nr:DUF1801 domain-containing protein [Altererythrobacter sp. Root672]KRA84654.1 hypothetical protein ASD76_06690 [Altererythrobacter sp. Root672]